MSSLSEAGEGVGNTPLVPLRKVIKPHKINPLSWEIEAKCEFRNPSGSIWDRLVSHGMKGKTGAFVTGGINELCFSLARAVGAVPNATSGSGKADDVTVSLLLGRGLEDGKVALLKGLGGHVILSYQQDPTREFTQDCLEGHVKDLEVTSGVVHHRIMPYSTENSTETVEASPGPYDLLVEELNMTSVSRQNQKWDLIVCSAQDHRLLQSLGKKFPSPDTLLVGVDFGGNTFTETVSGGDFSGLPGVKLVRLVDAICYDMARRLVREEGLLVGPIAGGIMAAALKEISSTTTPTSTKRHALVILPDSLQNTEFLSVDWMVRKGYYPGQHMESLFWWYEMALENINPPEVLLLTPETSTQVVLDVMNTSSLDRGVVVSNTNSGAVERRVIGVVTRDYLLKEATRGQNDAENTIPVGDLCIKQFGLIDSKANFSELERLLRKYHWVVNLHRIPVYSHPSNSGNTSTPPDQPVLRPVEDVLGALNMTDFMRYKKKIEKHHLTEYDIPMCDGIPSDVWLSHFHDHLQKNFETPSKP